MLFSIMLFSIMLFSLICFLCAPLCCLVLSDLSSLFVSSFLYSLLSALFPYVFSFPLLSLERSLIFLLFSHISPLLCSLISTHISSLLFSCVFFSPPLFYLVRSLSNIRNQLYNIILTILYSTSLIIANPNPNPNPPCFHLGME